MNRTTRITLEPCQFQCTHCAKNAFESGIQGTLSAAFGLPLLVHAAVKRSMALGQVGRGKELVTLGVVIPWLLMAMPQHSAP